MSELNILPVFIPFPRILTLLNQNDYKGLKSQMNQKEKIVKLAVNSGISFGAK